MFLRLVFCVCVGLTVLVGVAVAEVPQLINYQGILQSGGSPVTTPTPVIFAIWNEPTDGDSVWSEQQTITPDADGLFNVLLGSVSPIPDSAFASDDMYLSIKVDTDPEMTPRQRLASVAYAFRDNDWVLVDHVLYTRGEYGIARAGNMLYGNMDSTHVNLGYACTTGVDGQTRSFAVVGGGSSNTASGSFATISGGIHNTASWTCTTVGGGYYNIAEGEHSTVSGGRYNKARGDGSTIGGGGGGGSDSNSAHGHLSTISGGSGNLARQDGATVGGGRHNRAHGVYSVVAGGGGNSWADSNSAMGGNSAIGGGRQNIAHGSYSGIFGGVANSTMDDATYSFIGGGQLNEVNSIYGTIGGGKGNVITWHSWAGTIPGGENNRTTGDHAFAAGYGANAEHNGAFVWADDNAFEFVSAADNEFAARCIGGARFVTAIDGSGTPTAGVQLASGGGSWSSLSDQNLKENFEQVDAADVLGKIATLPITTWNYKAQDESIRHIGPMAQDLYAAFGLGEDETRIATINADGIALAAIQGLYEQNEELKQENETIKAKLAEVLTRLQALEGK